ncbi:MAG: cytochrome b [Sphingomicrobium sp.]
MDREIDGNPDSVPTRYVHAAIAIHWLSALLIISQIILGLKFADMPKGPERIELFTWHKTIGVAILLLAVVRLAVRLTNPAPPLPAMIPGWQRLTAVWSHRFLYFLMFALPITGLSLVSKRAVGGMTELIGGLKFPVIPLGPVGEAHSLLAWGMIGLLGLHVAAALKHKIMDGPVVSRRMSPFGAGSALPRQ